MTKIMCLADLHLTEKKPQCRPDNENWLTTVERKLDWILDLALEQKVDDIVIAGDVFDSVNKCSHEFMSMCIGWFSTVSKVYNINILAIPGNHDMLNNDSNRITHTPYGVLLSARLIADPIFYKDYGSMYYGEERTTCVHPIIVAHYGLWHSERPYKGAPDRGNVEWFIKNCVPETCKLFITGHYHVPFVTKVNGTTVVNCGCPFRMRADLINYEPYVTIADVADDYSVTTSQYAIPLEYDIRRDYIDDKKDRESALNEMVGNIEGDFESGFNFRDNFFNMSKECTDKDEINKEFERCSNGYYK